MRIAILSDIHGNLLALDACLADLEAQGGADAIVAAGDLCLDGPKPKKVLQRLQEIGAQCIRGNTDRYLSDAGGETFAAAEDLVIAWTRKELGEQLLGWLRELPFAIRIGEDDNQLLVVHANPQTDDEHLWPDAEESVLERMIGDERATAIAFGHLHLPYVRMWRGKLLVNVASAGLPKDGDPRACYAIFTERVGGWQVKHRRVAFDVKRVATQLADCGIPDSGELIATLRRHRYKKFQELDSVTYAIEIDRLVKRYGDFTAVDDVSLRIPAGEFFGFLGPNGAGKTTTINAIVGLAQKTSGTIRVFGLDNDIDWRAARRLIGLAPQEYNFDRYLSIRDVLIFQAGYFGLRGPEVNDRADMLLDRFGLASKSKQEYTKLSGGMKRRLTLARALIHKPKLLILDEPTAGVDVELRIELWDLLRELNGDGLTIFLTTHYLEEAEALCKELAIIRGGRIVAQKPTAELLADGSSLQDVFLELTRDAVAL